jgi:hypothetical protein
MKLQEVAQVKKNWLSQLLHNQSFRLHGEKWKTQEFGGGGFGRKVLLTCQS